MATASSAQREPSMEEILASIRRIIEDSDGGQRRPGDAVESATAVETFEDEATIEAAPDVDVFRAELRAGDGAEPVPKKPISLAEVQAQLASGHPASFGRDPAFQREPTVSPSAAVGGTETSSMVSPPQDASVPESAPHQRRDETAEPPEFSGSTASAADGDDLGGAQIEFDDGDLDLTDEPAVQAGVSRQALVSEETSRQVAAAFGELSEAFASRSQKSFDEMAEDMLRPMLQDWLDNNLPTLVERLVREEIERVARGGA